MNVQIVSRKHKMNGQNQHYCYLTTISSKNVCFWDRSHYSVAAKHMARYTYNTSIKYGTNKSACIFNEALMRGR